MTEPNIKTGQLSMEDLYLEMNDTDTFILLTINGDDVSVFSTLDDDSATALYLQAASKVVSLDE